LFNPPPALSAFRSMICHGAGAAFTWTSFYAAARQTYKEGTQRLRRDAYREYRGRLWLAGGWVKRAVATDPGLPLSDALRGR
jgi:hypothetical protein